MDKRLRTNFEFVENRMNAFLLFSFKHLFFISFFTLIVAASLFVTPLQAYYIDPPVHQYIGYQAYLILPDSPLKNELANYIGEVRVYNDTNFDSGSSVLEGIEEEDCMPPAVWYWYDPLYTPCFENQQVPRSWRHFWDPDMGYDAGLDAYDAYVISWPNQESAIARAQRFYNIAVQEYNNRNKPLAYWWLGRVAHLLEDMAQPAHVHNDRHPHSATDPYSNMVVNDPEYFEYHTSFIYLLYNGERGRAWSQDDLNAYPLTSIDYSSLPFNVTNTGNQNYNNLLADRKNNLFKLFLNLAETTDNFESEDNVGDADSIQENSPSNLIYWHTNGENLDTLVDRSGVVAAYNEVEIHADTLIPLAIRYVAGLYQLFWDETHSNNPPTLSYSSDAGYGSDGVNPNTGTSSTTFTYKVVYTDADNNPPSAISVYIDATSYAMIADTGCGVLCDGNYTNGEQFVYSTTLSIGSHNYYFSSSDGTDTARLPSTGTLSGPTVSDLAIATSTLPDGTVGSAYSTTLAATGGTAPYTWSAPSGGLPPGLTLNSSTGIISGMSTTTGAYGFTVNVTDSAGFVASRSLTITVNPITTATVDTLTRTSTGKVFHNTGVFPDNFVINYDRNQPMAQSDTVGNPTPSVSFSSLNASNGYTMGSSVSDLIFQADVMFTNPSTAEGIYIGFRGGDLNNYYNTKYGPYYGGILVLGKTVGGVYSDLQGSPLYGLPRSANTWYKIEVRAIGSSLQVYFDNILKLNASDTTITSGTTGFTLGICCSASNTWYVDNIKIFKSYQITVNNLQSGQKVELYDSSNSLKTSGTVASGQTSASLNVSSLSFPFAGYFKVYDSGGTLLSTSQTYSDIWGGDVYSFSGTPQIVFSSNRDGNSEIYVMNPDGTNQTRLTNNNANDYQPSWSSDGTKIVFTSDRDGNREIYIMNADGTNQTRLTNNPATDMEPSISPDGTKIAFRTNRDGINAGMSTPGVNEEIYVMNADGTNPVNLTNNSTPNPYYNNSIEGEPRWSPDGTKIVFSSWRSGVAGIWVMNADGTNPVQLTGNWTGEPSWSPDGTKIAYSGYGNIFVMNADGSNQHSILNVGCCISPYVGSWSPDGLKMVIYTDRFDGNHEIYTINSDGTNRIRLTNNNADDVSPYWSFITPTPTEFCGNNILDPGEECDDGNNISGDGCSALCITEFCGDGTVQAGLSEQCDDGNNINGDGCSATCQLEAPPTTTTILPPTTITVPETTTTTTTVPLLTTTTTVPTATTIITTTTAPVATTTSPPTTVVATTTTVRTTTTTLRTTTTTVRATTTTAPTTTVQVTTTTTPTTTTVQATTTTAPATTTLPVTTTAPATTTTLSATTTTVPVTTTIAATTTTAPPTTTTTTTTTLP